MIAVQGMGILRVIHNFTHHLDDNTVEVCLDEHSSDHTPASPPIDQDSDEESDQDCELCLSFSTLSTTLSTPPKLPMKLAETPCRLLDSADVLYSLALGNAHPVRGPPLRMIRS